MVIVLVCKAAHDARHFLFYSVVFDFFLILLCVFSSALFWNCLLWASSMQKPLPDRWCCRLYMQPLGRWQRSGGWGRSVRQCWIQKGQLRTPLLRNARTHTHGWLWLAATTVFQSWKGWKNINTLQTFYSHISSGILFTQDESTPIPEGQTWARYMKKKVKATGMFAQSAFFTPMSRAFSKFLWYLWCETYADTSTGLELDFTIKEKPFFKETAVTLTSFHTDWWSICRTHSPISSLISRRKLTKEDAHRAGSFLLINRSRENWFFLNFAAVQTLSRKAFSKPLELVSISWFDESDSYRHRSQAC